MKNILFICDGVIPTGFSRVSHSIIDNLPDDEYHIEHLAINYRGDPHDHKHTIYPALLGGDLYGFGRLQEFAKKDYDIIFILNDLWVTNMYLENIKEVWKAENKTIPKIVLYIPVDGKNFNPDWFKHFDIVTKGVAYTKFGYSVLKKAFPEFEFDIINHGVDTKIFYPYDLPKREIKKLLYPEAREDLLDSFIVLNANRNQPRKRIDVAVEGFFLFAEKKPENVKYYHHAGISDVGWDIIGLFETFKRKYGADFKDRLILSNLKKGTQSVSDDRLNLIYNATDVGLNTSLGEGWGLPSCEHAATKAPQIVPDNSSSSILFGDCGILIPISQEIYLEKTLTTGGLVKPADVAEALDKLYGDEGMFETVKNKCYDKFTHPDYHWKNIALQWHELFMNL